MSGFCSLTSTHDPVFNPLTCILRHKCGHQPLQKAQCETWAESELILKSKHPFVTSLVELVAVLGCAVCQRDSSHSLNMSQDGIPGLLAKSVHPDSYFAYLYV